MALQRPTDVDSPEHAADRAWRRTRTLVTVLTFWGVVLVLIALGDDASARWVAAALPLGIALLGTVLSLTRRSSPVGPGLLRGAGLVLGLYAAGLVLLLLSLVL